MIDDHSRAAHVEAHVYAAKETAARGAAQRGGLVAERGVTVQRALTEKFREIDRHRDHTSAA